MISYGTIELKVKLNENEIEVLGQVVIQGFQVTLQSARNLNILCLQPWKISVFFFRLAVLG